MRIINQDMAKTSKSISFTKLQKEYDMEKGEKYYDVVKKKLRLIPTDDAEKKDLTGIKKWKLAPNRKSSETPLKKKVEKDECDNKEKEAKKV